MLDLPLKVRETLASQCGSRINNTNKHTTALW